MQLLPFQQGKKEFDIKEIRTFVKIGAECFESLYLGVKIDKEQRRKIISQAKHLNPEIKVYQMEEDPNAFRLLDKPITEIDQE